MVASLAPTAARGWAAAMASKVAMVVSPAPAASVVAAGVEDAHGGAAMAQWVTDGRIRGVTAASKRTGAEAEEELEEELEGLAKPWPTS